MNKVIEVLTKVSERKADIQRTESFFRIVQELMPNHSFKVQNDIANLVIQETKPSEIDEFISSYTQHQTLKDLFPGKVKE